MNFQKVAKRIQELRGEVIDFQRKIVAIPALSPTYEPKQEECGEARKVAVIKEYLRSFGITEFQDIDAPDSRVPGGIRPNLVARMPGKCRDKTMWVMAHTDVVPPGEMSRWDSDPYTLRVEGDLMYGRGVEDNHQGMVSGMMAMRAFIETGVQPECDIALLLIADEECGSEYGIKYVIENTKLFGKDDMIIVPDAGVPDGSEVEVAEKGILWARFHVRGAQCHASTPDVGVNAMAAGSHLVVRLEELRQIFDRTDPVFVPPKSTFTPTKREGNVPNINTMPGDDVFFLDCRILPGYSMDEVESQIRRIYQSVEKDFGVTIEYSTEQKEDAAPATPVDAPIVKALCKAVTEVYGVETKIVGVGGGTVAGNLRRVGVHCAVWSRMDETLHGPNEYAKISNTLGDATVFAHVALQPC